LFNTVTENLIEKAELQPNVYDDDSTQELGADSRVDMMAMRRNSPWMISRLGSF